MVKLKICCVDQDVSFTEKFRLIGSGIVSELPTCSSLQLMDPALIALQVSTFTR